MINNIDSQVYQIRPLKGEVAKGLTSWTLGPIHGAMTEPLWMQLNLDGERISDVKIQTGFVHKGIEKIFENHTYKVGLIFSDRLDPEGSIFAECLLCHCIEQLIKVDVPLRAQFIRLMLLELQRIVSHCGALARMSKAVGSETVVHYLLRDREKALDLFELLTGARFSHRFIQIGGVHSDVTEGFLERVLEFTDLIRFRIKEYNDILTNNVVYQSRVRGTGWMQASELSKYGIEGILARACGQSYDARLYEDAFGYHRLDFKVVKGLGPRADVYDRFVMRMREIEQSAELLKQTVDLLPIGPFVQPIDEPLMVSGEIYQRIETSRGVLGLSLVADGTLYPQRVQFRPAGLGSLLILPEILAGQHIQDLPLIVASLDLKMGEIDR